MEWDVGLELDHRSLSGRPVERDDGQRHDGRDAKQGREDAVELADRIADGPRVVNYRERRRRTVESSARVSD